MAGCLKQFFKAALVTLIVNSAAHAEVVLVVNSKLSLNSISAEHAANVFLGKISSLPDGTKLTPIDQLEGSTSRDTFYEKVAKKTPAQLNAYWSRLIFTGKGSPPLSVESDYDVLEMVTNDMNLIGYIDSDSVDESVKVIYTIN